MYETREYLQRSGRSPFGQWFRKLSAQAAAKVTRAVIQMEQGNLGDCKSVGRGVLERRIDWGPGLRIYLGRDGDRLIILLAGGSKAHQSKDIQRAQQLWADYKVRKKE